MKKTLPIIFYLFLCLAYGQNIDYLDHNNTRVTLAVSGNFFLDPAQNEPGFEVPVSSGNHVMRGMRFYFMGKDANGQLYASLGGDDNTTDIFDGPYSTSGAHNWIGLSWQICQEEIDVYKAWWEACEGPNASPQACQNTPTPSNSTLTRLYNWPAHGDFSQGQDYWMAPFYDHPASAIGSYDPNGGDYPLVKGCCATWRVQNDVDGSHTVSGTAPIGIEVRYQTFQYRNFGLLNDVTFVEIEVFNRGNTLYPEFVYGINAFPKIGDHNDDYLGVDSLRSMCYVYNADNNDFDYGANPPAFGIVALEEPLTSVLREDINWGTINGRWNEMNGLLASGQPLMNPNGGVTTFQYGDNPNISGGWSEETLGNQSGIRNVMLSTDRGTFAPGDTIRQTYAFIYVKEGDRLQNVDALYAAADEVHAFYDTIANAQCQDGVLDITKEETLDVTISPNPASDIIEIEVDFPGLVKVLVVSATGQVVLQQEGSNTIELNVDSISDGVYFVHLKTSVGDIVRHLIVQH